MNYKTLNATAVVIHSAATLASMNVDIAWIDHEHRKRGFFGVGYHYFIRRDGTIEKGRNDDRPGAHVRHHNHYTLGICMAGGLGEDGKGEDNFTDAQWGALAQLVAILLRDNEDLTDVWGHRDIAENKTICPSFEVSKWVASHSLLVNLLERNRRLWDEKVI